MSAASRLWRRAPLWRFALFSAIFFAVTTLFYPAPWLLRALPPFAALTHRIDHFLGRDVQQTAENSETEQTPAAPAPPQPGAGQQAQGQGQAGNMTAAAPPIDSDIQDLLPLAGRQLPLPAGIWHPVVTTQSGPHREVVSNVLVRTDRGVVTGVIVVRASTASIPVSQLEEIDAPCHDDRYYMRRTLIADGRRTQCVATNATLLSAPGDISAAADINWAFERLHVLGFPLPPVLVTALWIHSVPTSDGGINFESVNIALSPAPAGTTKLSTPLGDWSKEGIGHSPFTGRFVQAVNSWIIAWAPTLQKGYEGNLTASSGPRPGSEDPAWQGLPE